MSLSCRCHGVGHVVGHGAGDEEAGDVAAIWRHDLRIRAEGGVVTVDRARVFTLRVWRVRDW